MKVVPDWPDKLPCKMACVAEAPGADEVAKGRVLVGKAGRLTRSIVRVAGVPWEKCLWTNVFDVRLEDNNPSVVRKRPDYDAALARLTDELTRAAPNLIVTIGDIALEALTGEGGVTAKRGALLKATRLLPGVKVLPTIHPAAMFYQKGKGEHRAKQVLFPLIAMDFMKAWREARTKKLVYTKSQLWLRPTLSDITRFYKEHVVGAEVLAFDVETWARQITCISFAPNPHIGLVVPFVDWSRINRSYWRTRAEEVDAWRLVQFILNAPCPKIAQNGTYDIHRLWDPYRIKVRNYCEDTRLLHHAIYPELPKDLGTLGSTYANRPPWKIMRGERFKKDD